MPIVANALDVRINRPASDPSGFQWKVLDRNRQVLAVSSRLYATDREALREANAKAREIYRAVQS